MATTAATRQQSMPGGRAPQAPRRLRTPDPITSPRRGCSGGGPFRNAPRDEHPHRGREPMRLLYIDHYAGGPAYGMEHRPYYLAREWARRGHEVLLVGASFAH